MLLWASGQNATRVDFSVIGLNPFAGLALCALDGRLHDRSEFDPPSFVFPSTRRFPAPVDNVFFLVIDESLLPDGRFLVQALSNAVGATPVIYEIVIRGGLQVDFPGPPGFVPPPFCVVTGAEFDPAGRPLSGVRVTAYMESLRPSVASWGSVSGISETTSDVDGSWALPLAPSPLLMPRSTYRIAKRHSSFGISELLGIFVPSIAATKTIHSLMVSSAIRGMELHPSPVAAPKPIPTGYVAITGVVVDVTGKPMASTPVTIGTGYSAIPVAVIPNDGISVAPVNAYMPESEFATSTPANRVGTISAYPDAPVTTAALPIGAEIVFVTDGYGNTLGPPDVDYDPATGIVTFASPFVGVIKYREASDGSFRLAVPMPGSYWIKVGLQGDRHPFTVYGGITAFDIGKVVFYPSI